MGREVRRVPPNWNHPQTVRAWGHEPSNQPMHDQTFKSAAEEWKADFLKWEAGERPSYCDEESSLLQFWEWESPPPERAYYRPWKDEEATWFQVWETVSEGTPVTPPFSTPEELIDYLVEHGDEWDEKRGHPGWSRSAAENFVKAGWAPSMMVVPNGPESGIYTASTGFPE